MTTESSEIWQRHRTTPQERHQWVQHFHRSGLSRQEFAQRQGLTLSTLNRWLAPRQSVRGARVPTVALREVSLGPVLGPTPWIAEVERPDGWTVRLSGAALPLVKALLRPRPC